MLSEHTDIGLSLSDIGLSLSDIGLSLSCQNIRILGSLSLVRTFLYSEHRASCQDAGLFHENKGFVCQKMGGVLARLTCLCVVRCGLDQRALLRECRALLRECRALLRECSALFTERRLGWTECRSLLSEHRVLLIA